MRATFVDPYYGEVDCVYGKNNASATQDTGRLVQPDVSWFFTDVPDTANLAYPVYVAMANMVDQSWGWFAFAGQRPVLTGASVAAGSPVGIGGAGKVGATGAGKEIEGMVSVGASTVTIVLASTQTQNGSLILRLSKPSDGLFVGLPLSGTGIAAGSIIAAISPDGRTITMNSAHTATATGSVTVTATFTGWIIAEFQSPSAQGRIT
jgi:hypothetical protein